MTLALVSRVGLEQASMTDTLKFGPCVSLAAGISNNPNISTQKYMTEGDLNYEGTYIACLCWEHKWHHESFRPVACVLKRAPLPIYPFVCELAHQDPECNWLQCASSAQHILSCNKLWYQPVLHFSVLQPNSSFLCIPFLANVQAVIKPAV